MTEYNPAVTKTAPAPTKRPKRIFLWVFLAVQVLFLIWVISGASTGAGQPSDCGTLSAQTCNDAANTGTAIGVALVIGLWFFVDCFMAVGYAVYRMAKRP